MKLNFREIQRVQNTLTRLVFYCADLQRKGKFEHITPAVKDLHWLLVDYHVTFTTVTIVFSAIQNTGQLAYLRDPGLDFAAVGVLQLTSEDMCCQTIVVKILVSHDFRHLALSSGTTNLTMFVILMN